MSNLNDTLKEIVGTEHVLLGDAIGDDYTHDEALSAAPQKPLAVVRPSSTEEVARVLRAAGEKKVPVTPRGSGTGLSGACIPGEGGIVLSLERMKRVLEIDLENHMAVVEAGVTLLELNEKLAPHGLLYPVFPGELSASLGGNVNTNAGGMRAVKYGVTRHHVIGLEAVLPSGEVVKTGGKLVKSSTGYDLTQLIVGSEGTLAVVTQVIVKLVPRLAFSATLLAPFKSLEEVTRAVPALVASGIAPVMVEYIDQMTMMVITAQNSVDLGIPDEIRSATQAYLLVLVEGRTEGRVDEDMQVAGGVLSEHGALDVFVLPASAATRLVDAREKSFWAAKRAQASDVIDVVVPRAALAEYMAQVRDIAGRHGTMIPGCGHAGDGNVHMAIFESDPDKRHALMKELFEAGRALGGMISGEHGIGREKKAYYAALEDPLKLVLMKRIKQAFDPNGILNPGVLFD
ncbi:MAG TPA: FAD-binding oxidoreductase [Polyangiaceae bacterium]|nr:FAD-binding oxidoreductase [Polyangiaceae bacterium]